MSDCDWVLPFRDRKHDSVDLVDRDRAILCGSDFCQLLAKFEVPEDGTGIVKALNTHFESNRHLHTTRPENDLCFYLGTKGEIATRHNCPFCRIVTSALRIGNNLTRIEELHVQWAESQPKFDLVTISERGNAEGGVLALGVRIIFCEGPNHTAPTKHWGRTTNPLGFDRDQITRWLALCEDEHKTQCGPNLARLSTRLGSMDSHEFRLIDVRRECIVSCPWQSRYLALSYVWGQVEQLRLQKCSIDSLKAPGSLRKHRHRVPKTIRDAIRLVCLIGEKYLWVDTLCLVQDDRESMIDDIRSMDFIYQNALVTIVAADEPDANGGLQRLWSTSSSKTQSVQTIKPGLRLMALGAMDVHLKKSKWTSRAWTFQEQVLSRRMIVFVNEQVYFRCRQCLWSEDTCADKFPNERLLDELTVNLISLIAADLPGNGDLEDDPEPLTQLTNLLEYYCTRELTHESDAINAVSGILRTISTCMKSELLQGLPVVALDYMILFQIYAYKETESLNRTDGPRRRSGFPSWSWAGWRAVSSWNSHPDVSPIFPKPFNNWLDHGTWIVWYKSLGSEAPKAILEGENLEAQFRNEEEVRYSRTSQPDLSGRFGRLDTSKTVPTVLGSMNLADFKQELLRFYTVTITLTVSLKIPNHFTRPRSHDDDTAVYRSSLEPSAILYDSNGHFSGLIMIDIADFLAEDGEYELTLLSESQNSLFRRMDVPDPDDSNPFVSHQDSEQDWKLYWILLLTWCEGIAERRGLGQILQSSVRKSLPPGPQWREIVLG